MFGGVGVNLVCGKLYLFSEKVYLVLEGLSDTERLTWRLSGEIEPFVFGTVNLCICECVFGIGEGVFEIGAGVFGGLTSRLSGESEQPR